MAMRLHEIHPMIAHFPIVLLPLSVVSDVVGVVTENSFTRGLGRAAMPVALASMAVAAATGTIAQEGVTAARTPGVAQDLLTTHRNMNIVVFGMTAGLTAMRMRQRKPDGVYFALAAGALGALAYSGYLGGEMVHKRGVGVLVAEGVQPDRSPELRFRNMGAIVGTIFGNLGSGLARAVRGLVRGPRLPALAAENRLMAKVEGVPRSDSAGGDDFQGGEQGYDAASHRYLDDGLGGMDRLDS